MQSPELRSLTEHVAESGWLPVVAGLGWVAARAIVRALLPTGYHFRFMDRLLAKDRKDEDAADDT